MVGQLSNLAKCHCHYHDVCFVNPKIYLKEEIVDGKNNSMVVVHQYPPNYSASFQTYATPQGPVQTSANWPPGTTLYNRINGLMNCVFAYGGATLFNELMAEMRRPYVKTLTVSFMIGLTAYPYRYDFWKGFICAEIFIYACYLLMGLVVYSAQGQFSYNPAYQGN